MKLNKNIKVPFFLNLNKINKRKSFIIDKLKDNKNFNKLFFFNV